MMGTALPPDKVIASTTLADGTELQLVRKSTRESYVTHTGSRRLRWYTSTFYVLYDATMEYYLCKPKITFSRGVRKLVGGWTRCLCYARKARTAADGHQLLKRHIANPSTRSFSQMTKFQANPMPELRHLVRTLRLPGAEVIDAAA